MHARYGLLFIDHILDLGCAYLPVMRFRISGATFLRKAPRGIHLLEPLGLMDLDLPKLALPTVERGFRQIVVPANIHNRFATVGFPQNPYLLFCRISLGFHSRTFLALPDSHRNRLSFPRSRQVLVG